MKYTVSVIGNRAYPHAFKGTSGIEVYFEYISEHFPNYVEFIVYVKSAYQAEVTNSTKRSNLIIREVFTIKSKVLESIIYSFLSSIASAFDGSQVVWYHGVGQALFSFIPRIAGKKIILTVHGEDWKRKKWNIVQKLFFRFIAFFVFTFQPHTTFVVSNRLRKQLLSEFSVNSRVAPPGLQFPSLSSRSKNTEIVSQLGLKKNKYFIYIGRIVPEKRLELLISVFQVLVEQYPSFKLVIVGGHGNTKKYYDSIVSSAHSKNILFPGHIFGLQKNELLAQSRAIILPSEIEGNPISIFEALALGKEVLVAKDCIESTIQTIEGVHTFTDEDTFYFSLEKMLKTKAATILIPQPVKNKYFWKRVSLLYQKTMFQL